LGEVGAARLRFVQPIRTGNHKSRTKPRPIFFKLRRTADYSAVDYAHFWSGGSEVRERFARCAGADGVEVEEVQWVAALLILVKIGICGSGDDTICDCLRVSLRRNGENVVCLVAEFEVCGEEFDGA
jgi:hypothetical protein